MYCPFCHELATGDLPPEYNLKIESRVIDETENFAVIVDLSPLVVGHILIIPKEHILAFGAVPVQNRMELCELLNKSKKILSQYFTSPIIFEHGSSTKLSGGACISHAHLQIIPVNSDFGNSLSPYTVVKISSFWDISVWSKKNEPYIFFQNQRGDMFVAYNIEDIPKQFIRIEVANKIGKENLQWNWRQSILRNNLFNSIKILREVWR